MYNECLKCDILVLTLENFPGLVFIIPNYLTGIYYISGLFLGF